jgi:hypothetical protein
MAVKSENGGMAHEQTSSYLKDSTGVFRYYKKLADGAMAQCPDDALFTTLDAESNSIGIIVKHLAGNMRSRWKDFLTTDGEKPDRDRDSEFEAPPTTRAEMIAMWEGGWKYVFDALEPLTDADLTRTVNIRSKPHSVMQAINRQLAHYSHHIGQILLLAKHFVTESGKKWESLSIPRGPSKQTTANIAAGKNPER